MQRLNIPLDRSIHATRPHRRVVWILALCAPALSAFFIAGWWFERPDVGTLAPEGTQLIFRLQPGASQWETVLGAIGHLTAVSDRALTLRELAPYSAGELSVYVDTEGRRSTAIRCTPDRIPHALLDAYGIAVQSADNGLVLLTDRVRPTEKNDLPRPKPWIGFGRIGTVFLREQNGWKSGVLTAQEHGWSIRLPKQTLPASPFPHLPKETVAFLATPASTKDIELSGVTERMESILAPFDLPALNVFSQELLQHKGGIVLTKQGDGFSFLLGGRGGDVSEDGWKKLLLAAAAFRHPKTQAWTLPDDTKAQEIRVDPSTVTMEERTVLGSRVLQVRPTAEETLLLALQTGGRYALTDNESLMNDWLGKKTSSEAAEGTCERGQPAAYVNLQTLYAVSQADITFHTPSALRDLSQTFHAASLKNTLFSSVLNVCF